MSIHGKTVLVVVPARGGSKGILKKNLQLVDGKSLIARAAEVARELAWVDQAVISTDDEEMMAEGVRHGLVAPFIRPSSLSGDSSSAASMWKHAVIEAEAYFGCTFDYTALLEPTSPFRKAKHVLQAIETLIFSGYDSVISVSETDSKAHPLKQLVIDHGKLGSYEQDGDLIVARQQLNPVYHRNGVVYAIEREALLKGKPILGENTAALLISEPVVNIDTQFELELANWMEQKPKQRNYSSDKERRN
jgi:CMP-N,N'-diacetyllegionaminic acid synthase